MIIWISHAESISFEGLFAKAVKCMEWIPQCDAAPLSSVIVVVFLERQDMSDVLYPINYRFNIKPPVRKMLTWVLFTVSMFLLLLMLRL